MNKSTAFIYVVAVCFVFTHAVLHFFFLASEINFGVGHALPQTFLASVVRGLLTAVLAAFWIRQFIEDEEN